MIRRPTLQDILAKRQRAEFVGREQQIEFFRRNLATAPEDARRLFILNVTGQGGVGKTSLLRRFREVAQAHGAATASTNEVEREIPGVMIRLSTELTNAGIRFKRFLDRSRVYLQKRDELEADPDMPQGSAAFAARALTKTGSQILKTVVPGAGLVLDIVDDDALAEHVSSWVEHVRRKLTNKDEVRLVLDPIGTLTPIFLQELMRGSQGQDIVLFFDTYENTSGFIDPWLRAMFDGRFGPIPANMVLAIAGREELNRNSWVDYESLIARINLQPFTNEEALHYLSGKGIRREKVVAEILQASHGLPLLVATLASQHPQDISQLPQPTGTAIERFLKWIEDPRRREAALNLALTRTFNADILATLVGEKDANELFDWIRTIPFVIAGRDGWLYHPVVRPQLLIHKLRVSPGGWRKTHRSLAEYHSAQLVRIGMDSRSQYGNVDWQRHALEKWYHALCESPHENIAASLNDFVKALPHSLDFSSGLARTIREAGQDCEDEQILKWGERLEGGLRAYEGNDYDTVIEMFTTLLNQISLEADSRAVALGWRGEAYHWEEHHDQALSDFTQSLDLSPENDWILVNRGVTNRNVGNYREAYNDFLLAIRVNAYNVYAYTERGKILFQVFDDSMEALTQLNRAIELDPSYGWAYVVRGDLHRLAGNYHIALDDFNRAVAFAMKYHQLYWALVRRGDTYRRLGLMEDSIREFKAVLANFPGDDWAHYELALTYVLLGRPNQASVELRKAVDIGHSRLGARPGDQFQQTRIALYEMADGLSDRVLDWRKGTLGTFRRHHLYELYNEVEEFLSVFPDRTEARKMIAALSAYLERTKIGFKE